MVPDFGVATADAYEWYDAAHPMAAGGSGAARHPPALWPIGSAPLDNDLEAPVARRHPDIVAVKAALRAHGAVAALLSGSGAAVFGLFVRRREAVAAMGLLGRAGWRAILSRTVDRLEYQGRLIQRAAAGARRAARGGIACDRARRRDGGGLRGRPCRQGHHHVQSGIAQASQRHIQRIRLHLSVSAVIQIGGECVETGRLSARR